MGASTEIAWTDATFNPWWGCQRVSPGCEHCYAEAFAKRTGNKVWGPTAERRFFGDKHWAEPLKWNAAAANSGFRKRVFCASMADVFEDRLDLEMPRARLFALIAKTPWLDWQLLTKRPENVIGLLRGMTSMPANVWIGTTTEDQKRADARTPELRMVRARTRFLSVEPQLEHIDLDLDGIAWVIVGGESGGGARPFDLAWARSIVRQCKRAGVACFVKQLGAAASDPVNGIAGRSLKVSGIGRDLVALRLKDAKGGDWDEWPAELRVREFPASAKASP